MTVVVIFARAPVPGQAKTRLIPRLGAQGAASLHARMVERMVAVACDARIGPVVLACTPDVEAPLFGRMAEQYGVRLVPQAGRDLGERMWRALEWTIADAGSGIIVGTDCPTIDPGVLVAARDALAGAAQVVVAPAEDGGYGLIGARAPCASLFTGLDWGTDTVMAGTRAAINRAGLVAHELPMLWDVDHPRDYDRLCSEFPDLADSMRNHNPDGAARGTGS